MKYSYLFGPVFADTIILVERFESKNPGELNFRDFFLSVVMCDAIFAYFFCNQLIINYLCAC